MDFELEVLKKKYLLDGEESWEDLCERFPEFIRQLMLDKKYSPAGSVLANWGQGLSYSNCFTRDTRFITDKGIKSFYDFEDGDTCRVLTSFGNYENAVVNNHGIQPIWEITFRRGSEKVKVRCTPDHLWPTTKGLKPTCDLKVDTDLKHCTSDKLPLCTKRTEVLRYPCPIGIIHGLVFGDGYFNKKLNSCSLDLCGDSKELVRLFDPKLYKIIYQEDRIRIHRLPNYMKQFPDFESINDEYLFGFIVGWFAADGYIGVEGDASIFNASLDVINTLYEQLPRIGIHSGLPRLTRDKSPSDGNENQKCYALNIATISLCETMFLKTNHKVNYNKYISSRKVLTKYKYWFVHKVKYLGTTSEVWCLNVENKHTFVLERGIPTHNCYQIPIEDDSIEGIFDFMKHAARTFSYRGGVGTDISKLRYKGAPVNNAARFSSGSVSFLPLISTMILSIGQGSDEEGNIVARRGAGIALEDISHPDIEDFIRCKSEPDKVFGKDIFKAIPNDVSGLNLSVKVTDAFMEALEKDEEWDLVWNGEVIKTIDAHYLWNLIAEKAWASGDPGVMFFDNARKGSTTDFCEEGKVAGTNPCGEIWMPEWGNCNLSSFNLVTFVTEDNRFDWKGFRAAIPLAVRFADMVIDENTHPLKKQDEKDKFLRKIGIGITGLGDALAKMGLAYSSVEARNFAREVMKTITLVGFETSVELAKEKGCAPALETKESREEFIKQSFVNRFPEELKQDILNYGCRNTAMTSIAPTGSLSIILGNVTSGCEPLFEVEYYRKSRTTGETHKIIHPPVEKFNIPVDNYEIAPDIHWRDRVAMQAALQEWTTDSISSTVNLPSDTTVEEIKDIYKTAWEMGLKGITIYRDNSKDVQVLNKKDECKTRPSDILYTCAPKRPKALKCSIHRATIKGEKYIVLVGLFKDKPYEVFCGKADILYIPTTVKEGVIEKNGKGKYSLRVNIRRIETVYNNIAESLMNDKERALTRMISLGMRHGVYPKFIVDQLRKTEGSIVDFSSVIARILSKYAKDMNITIEVCPSCGSKENLRFIEGCLKCTCGWSKCGD